jgi:hypothetical protein
VSKHKVSLNVSQFEKHAGKQGPVSSVTTAVLDFISDALVDLLQFISYTCSNLKMSSVHNSNFKKVTF